MCFNIISNYISWERFHKLNDFAILLSKLYSISSNTKHLACKSSRIVEILTVIKLKFLNILPLNKDVIETLAQKHKEK